MPKLLAEFLREQQEPFSLDLYLLERGYAHVSLDYGQFLKGSSVCSLRKRLCAVTNCSEFVKALFNKNVLHRDGGKGQKRFSCTRVCLESGEGNALCREAENCSLSSEEEVDDANQKSKGSCMEDSENDNSKQLSPVSVLEETQSIEQHSFKATQCEPSTSQSTSKHYSTVQELQQYVEDALDSQYSINKRLLQQTKQLLIDCVREVIENHKRRDKSRQHLRQILDAEELWKLVCENVWLWSKDTNIVHLLHCDYMNSLEEWSGDYEQKKEGIAVEIGDDILEGIINEIVTF